MLHRDVVQIVFKVGAKHPNTGHAQMEVHSPFATEITCPRPTKPEIATGCALSAAVSHTGAALSVAELSASDPALRYFCLRGREVVVVSDKYLRELSRAIETRWQGPLCLLRPDLLVPSLT